MLPSQHHLSLFALILAPLAIHAHPLPNFGAPLTRPPPFFPPTNNQPRSPPSPPRTAKRTVLSGHGILLLPTAAQVQVQPNAPEEDTPEVAQISVNGKTYQVVGGIDATIDGIPLSEYNSGGTEPGLGEPEQQGVVVGGGQEEDEPDGLGEGGERGGFVPPGERGGYAEVGLGRERVVGVEGVGVKM